MCGLYRVPFKKNDKKEGATVGRRPPEVIMGDLDPMLLWFANTTGCRHKLLLAYFDDPHTDTFTTPPGFVCCDVCCGPEISSTQCTGIGLDFAITNYFHMKANKTRKALTTGNSTTQSHKTQAEAALRKWRKTLWSDSSLFPENKYSGPRTLLDDTLLKRIA